MRRRFLVGLIVVAAALIYSCSNTDHNQQVSDGAENKILQKEDGTISLNLENADCYSDMVHPSGNTAEWNVVVSKSGRFNVWLSSATRDTNDLHYSSAVMLNIHDKMIEAHPECDRVVHNSKDVSYPYFRADSFMGSLYIQDTGLYNIQVISDKILPRDNSNNGLSAAENTKLLSVLLTPIAR
jgi:hypothetical protein